MTDDNDEYKKHSTPEYDDKFRVVPEENRDPYWYPFVGKAYRETGVLIVGRSTYALMDKPWGPGWRDYTKNNTDVNRRLVFDKALEKKQYKPFKVTSEMFLGAADRDVSEWPMFWESVAFANFCQCVVLSKGSHCGCNDQSIKALGDTIKILKPKLVLVWGTPLWEMGFVLGTPLWDMGFRSPEDCEKINGVIPRVIKPTDEQPTPVVGIKHPSRYFATELWIRFLRDNHVSQNPVAALIEYLRQQPIT